MRMLILNSLTEKFLVLQCNHVPAVGSYTDILDYKAEITQVLNWPDPSDVIKITGKLQGDVDAIVLVE